MAKPEDIYNQGVFNFQNGNPDEALLQFEKVLEVMPWHSYSHFFIGFIWETKGDYQKARKHISKAISIKGDEPYFYNRLGCVFVAEGNIDLAINYFKAAVNLKASPEYYHNIGLAYHKKGMLREAIENISEAVKLEDDNYIYLNNLGAALCDAKKQEEAIKYFARATQLNPHNPEYFNNLGLALSTITQARTVEIISYHMDIANNPDSYNVFRQEIKKRLDLVALNYSKAIELNPENPDYYNNLGLVLNRIGDIENAIVSYLKAIDLKPDNGKYYNNLGLALEETCNYEQSLRYYKKALELAPWKTKIYYNLSLVYLRLENFAKAWENFEIDRKRLPRKKNAHEIYEKPEWNGEDISGKTIYVCWEQGLGDTLHYVRYLPFLKEMGAKVIFNCQPELINLLKFTKGFDLIVANPITEEKNEFDTFVFLMSLCRIFTANVESIPANTPYVYSSPELVEKWSEKFQNEKRLKIGFVWQAKFSTPSFSKRSCPVEKFVELAETFPDVMFYSMQKSPFKAEINRFSLPNLIGLSSEINDFADTSAVLEHMDLLISVDTSIVHLAGAMGKKVWNLLSFSHDWRWFLNRDYSLWYPTIRLIRQNSPGDWDSVFESVRTGILELL